MRLTIKGMTASTIAFNSLGIVIRGDSKNPHLYKESIARHIDVVNEDQLSEVNSLVNAGLISIEVETVGGVNEIPTPVISKFQSVSKLVSAPVASAPVATKIDDDNDIEDAPSKPIPENEQDSAKGRGRPKGAKNRKTIERENANAVEPKKIVKLSNSDPEIKSTDDIESRVVIMTTSGAKGGNMSRSASGEIDDNEATKASLEAMKRIEAEESDIDNDVKFCDKNLDLSEQNGLSAIVSSGEKLLKIAMQSSVLPEASQIKDRAVKFVDDEVDAEDLEDFIDHEASPDISNKSEIDPKTEDDDFLEV